MIWGRGCPVLSAVEIIPRPPHPSAPSFRYAKTSHALITASTSPWKSASRRRVRRKNARRQAGSSCSHTDIRCERRYAICLVHRNEDSMTKARETGHAQLDLEDLLIPLRRPLAAKRELGCRVIPRLGVRKRSDQAYLIHDVCAEDERPLELEPDCD